MPTSRRVKRHLHLTAGAVLGLVALAAALTIGAVSYGQARSRLAADVESTRADAYALSQLEWQMIAERTVTPGKSRRSERGQEQFAERLRQLDATHPNVGKVASVVRSGRRYLRAYDQEMRLLARGDLVRAEQVDERRVDPAFELLREATASANAESRRVADRASGLAMIVSGATVAVSALAVFLLLHREGRRRAQTERRQAWYASARRFEAMVAGASDMVMVTDDSGTVSYVSTAAWRLLGTRSDEMRGQDITGCVHETDRPVVRAGLDEVEATDGEETRLEYRVVHTDGSMRVLEARLRNALSDPDIRGVVWNVRDVTERRRLERQLTHQAFHDPLSGLANGALLTDRLGRALSRAGRRGSQVAAIEIDLDGFKDVNDTLGHTVGDEVITVIGARLSQAVRSGDTVARFGGDEFVVLLDDLTDTAFAVEIALRALHLVTEPVWAGTSEVLLTASAGVATAAPTTSVVGVDAAEDLIRDADIAMYAAKRRGRNRLAVFEPAMREDVKDRLNLSMDIRLALREEQIRVVYQPMIDLDTQTVAGFEALARWHHPTRGELPPATFIPLAEDSGVIIDLGRYVLRTACAEVGAWIRAQGRDDLKISVNVSGRQLADEDFVGDVRNALADSGLAPCQLVLEITESAVVDDLTESSTRLRELHRLGVRIAMDDFGTGYSALSYLRHLPIDLLKIDRSFVEDVGRRDSALLHGVAALATTLGLDTVAEGIETAEQLAVVPCEVVDRHAADRGVSAEGGVGSVHVVGV